MFTRLQYQLQSSSDLPFAIEIRVHEGEVGLTDLWCLLFVFSYRPEPKSRYPSSIVLSITHVMLSLTLFKIENIEIEQGMSKLDYCDTIVFQN